MEDILKQLGNVETHVSELRWQVSAISAAIPHLATKADLADLRTVLLARLGGARGGAAANRTGLIMWTVAAVLASGALEFAVVKIAH